MRDLFIPLSIVLHLSKWRNALKVALFLQNHLKGDKIVATKYVILNALICCMTVNK